MLPRGRVASRPVSISGAARGSARRGKRTEIPRHGTLAKVRQHIPVDLRAGNVPPDQPTPPPWFEGAPA